MRASARARAGARIARSGRRAAPRKGSGRGAPRGRRRRSRRAAGIYRAAAFVAARRALLFRRRTSALEPTIPNSAWSIKDAEKLYNMRGWGLGYFRINAEGHVSVHPDQSGDRAIDLYRLALDLNAQGIGLPLLLRFSDILKA